MRTEKKNAWSNELTHEYTFGTMKVIIEVTERGTVQIRDLKGRLIHIEHLLDLVDIEKLIEHEDKVQKHQQSTRNELLAEITQ